MKISSLLLFGILLSTSLSAQKYVTKNGYIKFFSSAPAENIEAHNRHVNSALDISNGNFVFKVLIKSFEFEKALMQEHFNENYMESDKIPNAMFTGNIDNLKDINFKKQGEYDAIISGTLIINNKIYNSDLLNKIIQLNLSKLDDIFSINEIVAQYEIVSNS